MNRKRIQRIYTVVCLGGKAITDDLTDCMVSNCTNLVTLEGMTGIKRDRLTYIFSRKKRDVLVEGDYMIFRSFTLYKGKQRVNGRERMSGYNRN